MKCLLILIIIFTSGCFHAEKKSGVIGAATNVFRYLPGYRARRLKNLDFYIETESKELKRQQIDFDSRVLRNKLIELDKVKEVETK